MQLDGDESENAISFSGCEAYRDAEQPKPVKFADSFAPGIVFPLVLNAPLDLSTTAAGDRITARVLQRSKGESCGSGTISTHTGF